MNSLLEINGYLKANLEPLRIKMGANNVVGGDGNIDSKLILLGEAPGFYEDVEDKPFVGRSGDLLDKMLKEAGLNRDTLYTTNTVKCRPSIGKKNRTPTQDEINICKPYLWKEIQLIKPKIIVTLGAIPTKTLLKLDKMVMGAYVGKMQNVQYMESLILPIWHPSFLLRTNGQYTQKAIEYLKLAKNYI